MDIKPLRLQRKRIKGYKMVHENGLQSYYVGRPGKFGSMLKMEDGSIFINIEHRRTVTHEWGVVLMDGSDQKMQELYRAILTDTVKDLSFEPELLYLYDVNWWVDHCRTLNLEELRGKNLYCFCPAVFSHCHASVLLELANK